jgi:hypothetical protein
MSRRTAFLSRIWSISRRAVASYLETVSAGVDADLFDEDLECRLLRAYTPRPCRHAPTSALGGWPAP